MFLRSVYRVVIALVAGFILYSLAGFLLAPLLLEQRLESGALDDASSRVAIERVSFNPYTFRIVLTRTLLESADGRHLGILPLVEAQVKAMSLLKRDPVITEVMVAGPEVLVALDLAESERSPFNAGLAFLMAGTRALAPVRVEHLALSGGRLRFETMSGPAGARSSTEAASVTDFDLEILDLDLSEPSQARFTLNAMLPRSASLAGEGTIANTGQGLRLNGDFALMNSEIEASGTGKLVFRAPRVVVRDFAIDSSADASTVALVQLEQPEIRLTRMRSGRIDLPEWLVRLVIGSEAAIAAVDRIEISDGVALVQDRTVKPEIGARIEAIEGVVRPRAGALAGQSSAGGPRDDSAGKTRSKPNLRLEGWLPGSGIDRVVASWRQSDRRALGHLELVLTDVDLALLSPYFRTLTDRSLESGRLDLDLRADRGEYGARSQARIATHGLNLGDCDDDYSRDRWPLQRALALLEGNDGRIELSLNGRAKESGPESLSLAGLGTALRFHLMALSARPFLALATLAGVPGQRLDRLSFEPGSAELQANAQTRLAALGKALSARPAVALQVLPSYDPRSDRDALAEQQVRLHIALATSAGPPGAARHALLDFDDRKVRVVLDEFGVERLSETTMAAISAGFSQADGAYYEAVFDQLVANEMVSIAALERLGSYRARSIIDELTDAGIAESRLQRADGIEAVSDRTDAVFLLLELVIPSTDSESCLGSS